MVPGGVVDGCVRLRRLVPGQRHHPLLSKLCVAQFRHSTVAAGVERESLYRALSVRGNPRLSTLVAITKAIGLRLTVEAA